MKTSNFQIGIIVTFLVFLVVAVLIFAGVIPLPSSSKISDVGGNVIIWGTAPNSTIDPVIQAFNGDNRPLQVYYIEKQVSTYANDLIEGFASGTGPDIFMLSNEMLTSFSNKIMPIPYTSYPLRTFQDSFISGTDIFISSQGILGIPVAVDPLVLYYNIDAFNSVGISIVPSTWDDFLADSELLTSKDTSFLFKQSGAALGTFNNISNAKEILYAMFMQSGSHIVVKDQAGNLTSDLNQNIDSKILKFYMQFADSSMVSYSWNSSFNGSLNMFISSDLAQYIGFASELPKIQSSNPNLQFDIAKLPQIQKGRDSTYGKIYAFAVSKTAKNATGATRAIFGLTTGDYSKNISKGMSATSARKDLLAGKPENSYDPILNSSAFISKSVIEPSSENMNKIFGAMINGIRSGSINFDRSISDLDNQIDLLLSGKRI